VQTDYSSRREGMSTLDLYIPATDSRPLYDAILRHVVFFFSSRRRHTRSVSAFLLNRSSDLLPFKALMFLTLMRPSLVLFLVLWLKLVKDFLKVRCRLALLPFLISCLIWLDLVASLPLIKERILVIILLLHFLSL